MAKKKKSKMRVAGLTLSRPAGKTLLRFVETPLGREIAAAALAAAASTLITRFPKAAAVSAGSGAASAAKTAAHHTVHGVVHLLRNASDRLRHGLPEGHPERHPDADADGRDGDRFDTAETRAGGNDNRRDTRKGGLEDDLFAGLSPKQLRKLAKALRHA